MKSYNGPVYTIECQQGDSYAFNDEEFARWFQFRRAIWPMRLGNIANDDGNFFMTPEERNEVLKKEPGLEKFIHRVLGSDEFINNKLRYCFWLVDASPADIKHSRILYERVRKIKEYRLASRRPTTQKLAEKPTLFAEIRQPTTDYLLIPLTSSHLRKYIPMGYMSPDVIVTHAVSTLANATPYHFGILTSRIHMAWMRVVSGKLKSDYRYSNTIVYNNFIWPKANPLQVMRIESTGIAILKARENYPECSLADLYDEVSMPSDLRKAHNDNDDAVCEAYGLPKNISEYDIMNHMFRLNYAATGRELPGEY